MIDEWKEATLSSILLYDRVRLLNIVPQTMDFREGHNMNQAVDLIQYAPYQHKYRCRITESLTVVESGVCVITYGLYLRHRDPLIAQQMGEEEWVDAISTSYEEVLTLKQLIEEMDVYPCHLKDVIEDYLS